MDDPKTPGEDESGKGLEHLRRAAAEASDPDRLLPGEMADSQDPDDARVWVDVYSELLEYKHELLAVTNEKLASMQDEAARREVIETDAVVIEAERARFERRLAFWTTRLG